MNQHPAPRTSRSRAFPDSPKKPRSQRSRAATLTLVLALSALLAFLSWGCIMTPAATAEVPVELRADLGARPVVESAPPDGYEVVGTVSAWVNAVEANPALPGMDSVGAWRLRRRAFDAFALEWDLIAFRDTGGGIDGTYLRPRRELVGSVCRRSKP